MAAVNAADLPVGSIVASARRCLMKVRDNGWKYVGDTDLEPDVHAQMELADGAAVLREGY